MACLSGLRTFPAYNLSLCIYKYIDGSCVQDSGCSLSHLQLNTSESSISPRLRSVCNSLYIYI
ncbi:hypothetical protein OIU74_021239 [Salix koriyanagi]|uniref:C3H1-type domain-containing protein n=1 Tax=Salix koriyanagi TaxID=2511006 RepID=A0A9Q0P7P0_9ROSI|nr:hypothetical protein OIU74_021239 [Salix koriyanagi]